MCVLRKENDLQDHVHGCHTTYVHYVRLVKKINISKYLNAKLKKIKIIMKDLPKIRQ